MRYSIRCDRRRCFAIPFYFKSHARRQWQHPPGSHNLHLESLRETGKRLQSLCLLQYSAVRYRWVVYAGAIFRLHM